MNIKEKFIIGAFRVCCGALGLGTVGAFSLEGVAGYVQEKVIACSQKAVPEVANVVWDRNTITAFISTQTADIYVSGSRRSNETRARSWAQTMDSPGIPSAGLAPSYSTLGGRSMGTQQSQRIIEPVRACVDARGTFFGLAMPRTPS